MHMSIVTFRALCTMSVLAAAKCAANAVVQNCKLPKQVRFNFEVQMSNLGSLYFE